MDPNGIAELPTTSHTSHKTANTHTNADLYHTLRTDKKRKSNNTNHTDMQPLESYQIQDHNFTLKPDESLLILGKRCHKNIHPAENDFKWHRRTDSIRARKGMNLCQTPSIFIHTHRVHHSVIENKHIIPDTPMNEKSIKYKR